MSSFIKDVSIIQDDSSEYKTYKNKVLDQANKLWIDVKNKENFFQKFISDAGGSTNAHTTDEYTNYYFEVLNEHLDKAIQIFSYFFIDPLLSMISITF